MLNDISVQKESTKFYHVTDLITIELNHLRFFAFHGLYDEEKKKGTDFEIYLEVSYPAAGVVITDLSATIDYVSLFEVVKIEMQKPRKLLETLAMEVVEIIHDNFPQIRRATFSVHKLNPPIAGFNGDSAGVKYTKDWPAI